MITQALLIIDYQNDFVSSKGKVASVIGAEKLKPLQGLANPLAQFMKEHRAKNQPIIFVCTDYDTRFHRGSFKEYRANGPYGNTAILGTWGHELFELQKEQSDHMLVKHFFDAFFESELESLLKNLKVGSLILCGINTDICVFHTALAAAYRGYSVCIPQRLTDTVTGEKGHYLTYLKNIAGINII